MRSALPFRTLRNTEVHPVDRGPYVTISPLPNWSGCPREIRATWMGSGLESRNRRWPSLRKCRGSIGVRVTSPRCCPNPLTPSIDPLGAVVGGLRASFGSVLPSDKRAAAEKNHTAHQEDQRHQLSSQDHRLEDQPLPEEHH